MHRHTLYKAKNGTNNQSLNSNDLLILIRKRYVLFIFCKKNDQKSSCGFTIMKTQRVTISIFFIIQKHLMKTGGMKIEAWWSKCRNPPNIIWLVCHAIMSLLLKQSFRFWKPFKGLWKKFQFKKWGFVKIFQHHFELNFYLIFTWKIKISCDWVALRC